MENQSNCAFWQSQINFDDFFLISQGIDALCKGMLGKMGRRNTPFACISHHGHKPEA
jgi:hypothetical protein